jgi:hypothetical protein
MMLALEFGGNIVHGIDRVWRGSDANGLHMIVVLILGRPETGPISERMGCSTIHRFNGSSRAVSKHIFHLNLIPSAVTA